MPSTSALTVGTFAELQRLPVSPDATVLVVSAVTFPDNGGGFYRWSPSSTADTDRFSNALPSNRSSTGRWLRVFQRSRQLPGGVLVMTGGVKSFYAAGVTDANGQCTVSLTENGLAKGDENRGASLFTEVWLTSGEAQRNANGPLDTVTGNRVSLSADLRTLVYQFEQAQQTKLGATLALMAGAVITPLAPVAAGTPVTIRVDGV